METIAPKTTPIDVEYLGNPEVIAACLLDGDGSLAIVDPGPTSAVATLRSQLNQLGLSVADLDTILLTHAAQFAEQVTTKLKRHLSERDAERYAKGAAVELSWYGLARYWRKRNA